MHWLRRSGLSLFLLGLSLAPIAGRAQVGSPVGSPEASAMRVLDDFLAAYNASDAKALVATLQFPHVRIAGNTVKVFANPAEYLASLALEQHGWDYASWVNRRVVQKSIDKVHVAARFARFRAGGVKVDEIDSFYVVILRNGRWGIMARSSLVD